MIATAEVNVHQYLSLLRCRAERKRRSFVCFVCLTPLKASSPGSCSLAPPRGPEWQRQPLLDTTCREFLTSEWPIKSKWGLIGRNWKANRKFSRTGTASLLVFAWRFHVVNQTPMTHKRKSPSFVSVISSLVGMAAHISNTFKTRFNIFCRNPSSHPGNYSTDSLSVWQDVVVAVVLPALVSLRKLGFSIVTATSLLIGFSSVKARFSELLASPSLSTHIKFKTVQID